MSLPMSMKCSPRFLLITLIGTCRSPVEEFCAPRDVDVTHSLGHIIRVFRVLRGRANNRPKTIYRIVTHRFGISLPLDSVYRQVPIRYIVFVPFGRALMLPSVGVSFWFWFPLVLARVPYLYLYAYPLLSRAVPGVCSLWRSRCRRLWHDAMPLCVYNAEIQCFVMGGGD